MKLTGPQIGGWRASLGGGGDLRSRIEGLLTARGRSRAPDPKLIRFVELLLAIAIGAVAVSIFWKAAGPVARPSSAPRVSAVQAAPAQDRSINPFRSASSEIPAAAEGELGFGPDLAETTLNLTLHGTWTTPEGGAAFIKTPDEKQGRYSVGDTITSGVRLENVYRDQVVISRGGVRESLRLINRDRVAPPPQQQAVTPAPGPEEVSAPNIGGLIGQVITAQPVTAADGGIRFVLGPAGDEAAFERLGLRAGDILVAINNQPLGANLERALGEIATLGGNRRVTISVERDGVVLPVMVTPPGAER